MLLYGLKRSKSLLIICIPFGYGKSCTSGRSLHPYLYSDWVAAFLFCRGTYCISFIPLPLENANGTYAVPGTVCVVWRYISPIIAARAFNRLRVNCRGGVQWWKVKTSYQFLVLFEDGAAVLGLLIVGILMALNQRYNLPVRTEWLLPGTSVTWYWYWYHWSLARESQPADGWRLFHRKRYENKSSEGSPVWKRCGR